MPSDLTSRASLSLSLFLFSGASNRDPCCFWCIAQSHPACKQWDKKIQCLRFCPWSTKGLLEHQGIRLDLCLCSLVPFDWLSGAAPTQCRAKETKVLKSSKFGFTAKLGWPSKVGVIPGSKFWTLSVLLVKRLVKKGHERTWRCSLCIEKSDKKRSYALQWCSSHFALTPPPCPINSYDRALL